MDILPSLFFLAESGWGVAALCRTSEAVSASEHTALGSLGKETESLDCSTRSAATGGELGCYRDPNG
jgi:hypothetical protein